MYVIGCFLKVPGLCFNTICGILQVGQVTDVGSLCFCESQIVACAVYTIFQKVHIYQCMVAVQGILSGGKLDALQQVMRNLPLARYYIKRGKVREAGFCQVIVLLFVGQIKSGGVETHCFLYVFRMKSCGCHIKCWLRFFTYIIRLPEVIAGFTEIMISPAVVHLFIIYFTDLPV